MSEENFASLGPTLLARKGGAKPAMRPQVAVMPSDGSAAHNLEDLGWNDMGDEKAPHHQPTPISLTPEPANAEAEAEAHHNDELAEADLAKVAAPQKPAIVEQQELLAKKVRIEPKIETKPEAPAKNIVAAKVDKPVAPAPRKRRSALARGKRAAFTLRLDAERHLNLRLASTLRGKSAQQLVTEALDQMLGSMSDVKTLAAQAKAND